MITLALLFILTTHASVTAPKVLKISGLVSAEKMGQLKAGEIVPGGLKLDGAPGSTLLMDIGDGKISLSGPFSFTLEPSNERPQGSVVSLLSGKLRALVNTSGGKTVPAVRTPSAAMGVRGTDFFASYNTLLGESEIICFSHEVEFAGDKANTVRVGANHWGGIGGRFGKKIAPPMALPPTVVDHFKNELPIE